jgi:hypothetical protein
VIVWHLARDASPQAHEMRQVLVRLSGRQIKRCTKRPTFTEPALLAGLGVLMPMRCVLEEYTVGELIQLARQGLPCDALMSAQKKKRGDAGFV